MLARLQHLRSLQFRRKFRKLAQVVLFFIQYVEDYLAILLPQPVLKFCVK
jgi:hypothetical protein